MALSIKIPLSIADNPGDGFFHLFQVIQQMEETKENDIVWDFNHCRFLTPFFLLPIELYRNNCGKNIDFINVSADMQSYFDAIHFNGGLTPESLEDKFKEKMEHYSLKTFIPIIDFPSSKTIPR